MAETQTEKKTKNVTVSLGLTKEGGTPEEAIGLLADLGEAAENYKEDGWELENLSVGNYSY